MSKIECLGCGEIADGSVGATGIVWPVCQKCKEEEDAAADRVAQTTVDVMRKFDEIFGKLRSTK